ncbi:Isopenicillin N synthase [Macleaya cordata]|uniref:Isopenicillin N synthase n=1 Tax=Macleaya cordata TaxID=56857 RepID=A0A200QJ99_MACCD|nr:Isopenicillin N synthase [Macleaya cordata]
MDGVDVAFIQPIEHRPKPNNIVEAGGIPLIDLSPLNYHHFDDSIDALRDLVDKVGSACRDWGFFHVINHGVPSDLQKRVEVAVKKFFALSSEEKRRVQRDEVNPLGYYDTEYTKNVRDWKEVFDFMVNDPTILPASHQLHDHELHELRNKWPDYPPELREVCEEYARAVEKLSFKLLELVALSLGLPEKRLNGYFNDEHTSFIRLKHYPACPAPHLALGVGRHKDGGALTVLAQDDVGGLEVKRKTDGEWVRVKPIQGSFVINVGDIIQVWSNDVYESPEHRVMVNSERERFSIPFSLNPAHHVMVKPLEEFINKQNPAKYKEYNWGKVSSIDHFLQLFLETMEQVDVAFVQALEHRPKPNNIVEAGGIPLIDLSPLLLNSSHPDSIDARCDLIAKIGSACRDWGFFQVINHGVSSDLQQRVEVAVQKFFDQSSEEKRKVQRDEVNPLGYYDTEHTKNVRDWKEVFDFTVQDPTLIPASHNFHDQELQELRNQWPDYPPQLREVCEEYARAMEELSFKVLELVALSLGLPEKRFNSYFINDHTSFIRLNHYPPCPAPLGVGRHKDSGALTVLAQDDVGGLDVKRRTDGEWVSVKPIQGSYIINVGDIIQVWSNDKYESAEHRVVVNSERERFSIPFFFNPSHHVMVKPLEELINKHDPPKYREYNWGKFFKTRKLSDFKKLDVENIQIYHFKIPG